CFLAAAYGDQGKLGDPAAQARTELLTPIAKAWSTDVAVEVASLGVQVHGGMGFVEETGAAQHYRDARIGPIYEGTNGVMAIDFIMRRVVPDHGAVLNTLIAEMQSVAEQVTNLGEPRFGCMAPCLK